MLPKTPKVPPVMPRPAALVWSTAALGDILRYLLLIFFFFHNNSVGFSSSPLVYLLVASGPC